MGHHKTMDLNNNNKNEVLIILFVIPINILFYGFWTFDDLSILLYTFEILIIMCTNLRGGDLVKLLSAIARENCIPKHRVFLTYR